MKKKIVSAMLCFMLAGSTCVSAAEIGSGLGNAEKNVLPQLEQENRDEGPDWYLDDDDEPEVILDDGEVYPQTEEDYAQQFVETYGPIYDEAARIPSIPSKINGETVYFEYDDIGDCVRSVRGDEYIRREFGQDFCWGKQVIKQERNGVELSFTFSEYEACDGIWYNGEYYRLVSDGCGSVAGIENNARELVAKYEYDENKNCRVFGRDENGEWTEDIKDPAFIGFQNPYRWCWGYYDSLTGYYLDSGIGFSDVETGERFEDKSILAQIDITDDATARTTKSDIDKEVSSLMNDSSHGKEIKYSAEWYSSLSKKELLSRLIYAECMIEGDQKAVTWELMNRKAANWSGFYGSGRTNTLKNIATAKSQYSCIVSGEDVSIHARNPAKNSPLWKSATWYACALSAEPSRSRLGSLVSKPRGFDKQCNHVGMVLRNLFSGSGTSFKYSGMSLCNVMLVGVDTNITSAQTLKSYYTNYKNQNVFFNLSADYPSKYDFV